MFMDYEDSNLPHGQGPNAYVDAHQILRVEAHINLADHTVIYLRDGQFLIAREAVQSFAARLALVLSRERVRGWQYT